MRPKTNAPWALRRQRFIHAAQDLGKVRSRRWISLVWFPASDKYWGKNLKTTLKTTTKAAKRKTEHNDEEAACELLWYCCWLPPPSSDMFLRQIRCLSAFDRMERKENCPLSTFSIFEVIVRTLTTLAWSHNLKANKWAASRCNSEWKFFGLLSLFLFFSCRSISSCNTCQVLDISKVEGIFWYNNIMILPSSGWIHDILLNWTASRGLHISKGGPAHARPGHVIEEGNLN